MEGQSVTVYFLYNDPQSGNQMQKKGKFSQNKTLKDVRNWLIDEKKLDFISNIQFKITNCPGISIDDESDYELSEIDESNSNIIKLYLPENSLVDTRNINEKKQRRILCIGGGGIRGYGTIQYLRTLEKAFPGQKIRDQFDIIIGTSVGAIIAAILCYTDWTVDEIDYFMRNQAQIIFPQKSFLRKAYNFYSKGYIYDSEPLKRLLEQHIGKDRKLQDIDIKSKTAFGVTIVGKNGLCLLVNQQPQNEKRFLEYQPEMTVVDAILKSAAAPIAFNDHEGDLDGGVGANNPSLYAYLYAKNLLKNEFYHILFIGTGKKSLAEGNITSLKALSNNTKKHKKGKLEKIGEAVEKVFECQEQVVFDILDDVEESYQQSEYYHLDFKLNRDIQLWDSDDVSLDELKNSATFDVLISMNLKRFLQKQNVSLEMIIESTHLQLDSLNKYFECKRSKKVIQNPFVLKNGQDLIFVDQSEVKPEEKKVNDKILFQIIDCWKYQRIIEIHAIFSQVDNPMISLETGETKSADEWKKQYNAQNKSNQEIQQIFNNNKLFEHKLLIELKQAWERLELIILYFQCFKNEYDFESLQNLDDEIVQKLTDNLLIACNENYYNERKKMQEKSFQSQQDFWNIKNIWDRTVNFIGSNIFIIQYLINGYKAYNNYQKFAQILENNSLMKKQIDLSKKIQFYNEKLNDMNKGLSEDWQPTQKHIDYCAKNFNINDPEEARKKFQEIFQKQQQQYETQQNKLIDEQKQLDELIQYQEKKQEEPQYLQLGLSLISAFISIYSAIIEIQSMKQLPIQFQEKFESLKKEIEQTTRIFVEMVVLFQSQDFIFKYQEVKNKIENFINEINSAIKQIQGQKNQKIALVILNGISLAINIGISSQQISTNGFCNSLVKDASQHAQTALGVVQVACDSTVFYYMRDSCKKIEKILLDAQEEEKKFKSYFNQLLCKQQQNEVILFLQKFEFAKKYIARIVKGQKIDTLEKLHYFVNESKEIFINDVQMKGDFLELKKEVNKLNLDDLNTAQN